MRHRRFVLRLIVLSCLLTAFLCAQQNTGDIRGVIKDPSGAVVSGATIQITDIDRQIVVRTVKTDASGNYVAAFLPVGRYKITIQAQGFKDQQTTDVALNVYDHLTIDANLQVAKAGETVTVNEAPPLLELDNNTGSSVITGSQVQQLTLVTRNYEQLVAATPGVSTFLASDQIFVGVSNPWGTSNQINFAVNGTRPTQNNWQIDGADNVDRGANLTLLAFPSVDSIAEFNVLRSNYLPENGRSSGAEINVITRGGTNQFHGDAYEFFRNDVLNGNNYFNNLANLPRPAMRWNDFGFTVGGPIWKQKTFFFYSQEWKKIETYTTFNSGVMPTQAELNGTFSNPVCTSIDANGNCASVGTQMTSISPTAAAYVKDIYSKLPAANDGSALIWTGRNQFNYREENLRIDQNVTSKLSLFGRFLDDTIPTVEPGGLFTGLGVPGVATTSTNAPGRNIALHGTMTFTPTMMADFGYAFSYGAVISTPTGSIVSANSPDINPTLPFGLGPRVPSLSFDSNGTQGVTGFGPYNDYNRNHNAFFTLTKALGAHTMKFGATFNHYQKDEDPNGYGGQSGTYNFYGCVSTAPGAGAVTSPFDCNLGNTDATQEWANFLMGNVYYYNQTNIDFHAIINQREYEAFAQDEWRIKPNFTFDYGVRYSLFQAPTYGNGLMTTFDPAAYNPANTPAISSSTGNYVTPLSTEYTNGIIIGGKNSPYGSAVMRTPKLNFAPRIGFAWDPFRQGTTSIRGGFGIFFDSPAVNSSEQFQPGNPPFVQTSYIFNTNLDNPASVQPLPNGSPMDIGGVDPNWKQPYTMMWNLDVQHQLSRSMTLDVGYYGNVGRHLVGVLDINQAPLGAFTSLADPNNPPLKLTAPFTYGDTNLINQIRPYQGWASIDEFSPVFTSNYNGLQASFTKHFTQNSLVTVNYTWSHALGTAQSDYSAAMYTAGIRGDYGNLNFDRRSIFTANYVYDLPFFRAQQGITGHTLGGWEVSGVFYANTGSHLTEGEFADPGGLGLMDFATFEGSRPDLVSNPNQGAPHTLAEWFNTAAFAAVPSSEIRVGNSPQGTIVGPGYFRWDASLFKNFKVTERFNLQFRAEAFNVLNHTNFNNPVAYYGSGLNGQILSARDPRNMQMALKLTF